MANNDDGTRRWIIEDELRRHFLNELLGRKRFEEVILELENLMIDHLVGGTEEESEAPRIASAEIKNDIPHERGDFVDAAVEETRAKKIARLLDDYYTDPDTDPINLSTCADCDYRAFSDPRASVIRLAALLLGLCIVAGASAFVAATGGGVGWALAVFVVLVAVFGLGVAAGRQ